MKCSLMFILIVACACRKYEPLPEPRKTIKIVPSTDISNNKSDTIMENNATTSGTNTLVGVATTPSPIVVELIEAKSLVNFTYDNLPAAPGGEVQSTEGRFTLFSLRTNSIVPNSDSATTKWDIGFKSTIIIFNSGTSGPGNAGVQTRTGIFDDIAIAPTTGFRQDNMRGLPSYALATGSGNGWFNYNLTSHVVKPIPGRILLIRTANDKYAKLEILNFYKDAPANPTSDTEARYYKFRYSFQGDGSTTLK